jgi:two-component system, chemotaxis family, chemotaxis protein CheY
MMMPYLDGSNFVKNLKISGFYRDTPVIVLSGSENLEETITKMPFKVDGFLSKPFNPTELSAIIDNILSNNRDHATS